MEDEDRNRKSLVFENPNYALGFTQVPNFIIYSEQLSPTSKYLYSLLCSYGWKGDIFPGYKTLCLKMQMSRESVRGYMKELRDMDLISWSRVGLGLNNNYVIKDINKSKLDLNLCSPALLVADA